MRFLVIMDGDGHFNIAPISQREKVIELLQDVSDGDYWANEFDEDPADLLKLSKQDWEDFVDGAQCRGQAEIVNVEVPLADII